MGEWGKRRKAAPVSEFKKKISSGGDKKKFIRKGRWSIFFSDWAVDLRFPGSFLNVRMGMEEDRPCGMAGFFFSSKCKIFRENVMLLRSYCKLTLIFLHF